MKTKLEDAYKKATRGPLTIRNGFPSGRVLAEGSHGCTVAITQSEKHGLVDAALLAHAFNVLPEVVEALQKLEDAMCRHQNDPELNEPWDEILAQSMEALARVSTVEVPE
jgi:hypothetical protein